MKLSYNKEKINKIIRELHLVTGLSYAFYDAMSELNLLCVIDREEDEFCHRIQTTDKGQDLCKCSDEELLRLCRERGAPVSHICHAGIADTAVPIRKNGIIVGFVVIGRVRPTLTLSDSIDRLSWLGDSTDELAERYSRLSYFSPEQMTGLTELISEMVFDSAVMIEQDSFASDAEEYIEKNLASQLSVDTLCRYLFVSKNRLYSGFKEAFGCTVNDYITSKRIERARELILSGKSVRSAADEVGINNYTYFSKLFKKCEGVSPTAYKRKYTKSK